MGLKRIEAADAIARLAEFGSVIDARSPAEFAEDRLPGAVNWPSLDDEERARIGTMYKQVSPFAARQHGAVCVARNVANHVERHVIGRERDWRPLVYCWRGGQRSGALATVLDQIGFAVTVLEGGYREFRRVVVERIETLPTALDLRVLVGRTGSAKSRLLQALAAAGAQVLDLEALAKHRGSVLGLVPGTAQPTQKGFDTALWQAMRALDAARPVWVEGESRMIGRVRLPAALVEKVRAAPVVSVEMPIAARVAFLMDDYAHFVADAEALCARLATLKDLRGAATIAEWQVLARAGRTAELVQRLLVEHYDPIYTRSIDRHFTQLAQARTIEIANGSPECLAQAAATLHGE